MKPHVGFCSLILLVTILRRHVLRRVWYGMPTSFVDAAGLGSSENVSNNEARREQKQITEGMRDRQVWLERIIFKNCGQKTSRTAAEWINYACIKTKIASPKYEKRSPRKRSNHKPQRQ